METTEDLIGALIALQKQTVTCTDVGQASAIARLAVGLKAVCNGTVDPTQVEFVRKVEPSPNPATPEEVRFYRHIVSVCLKLANL